MSTGTSKSKNVSTFTDTKKAILAMKRDRKENDRILVEIQRLKGLEAISFLTSCADEMFERTDQKIKQKKQKEIEEELIVSRQVSSMVRKEAIRQLLKSEEDQYRTELKDLGMTYFKERL